MKRKLLLPLLYVFLLFIILFTSPANAEVKVCYSCTNCSDELADNIYLELNNSISSAADCIKDTLSKSNVTIDCKGYNITDTDISTFGYGIELHQYSNISIKNCRIYGFNYGTYLYEIQGVNNKISNVTIKGSGRNGIFFLTLNNILITNTTITDCGGGGEYSAIYLYNSNHTNITRNTIQSNKYGIIINRNSDHNTITENTIINNNKSGIFLDENGVGYRPDNNTITDNKIRNNSVDVTPKYEIKIESGCAFNNISHNAFKHPIDNQEPSTILQNNYYSDLIAGPLQYYISDSETLSGALTLASPGNIILALKKIYNECLDITKQVTIKGEERDETTINCSLDKITSKSAT